MDDIKKYLDVPQWTGVHHELVIPFSSCWLVSDSQEECSAWKEKSESDNLTWSLIITRQKLLKQFKRNNNIIILLLFSVIIKEQ